MSITMSSQSAPSKNGIYRIKVFDQDLYIESIPEGEAKTPWMCLSAQSSDKKQQACAHVQFSLRSIEPFSYSGC
jgi:hypothetical protein